VATSAETETVSVAWVTFIAAVIWVVSVKRTRTPVNFVVAKPAALTATE
jgi:hypothetical protein